MTLSSRSNLYLRSLTVHGFRGFREGERIDFSTSEGESPAQWTIVLGENGTGKTGLLQAIVAMQPKFDPELGAWTPIGTEGDEWRLWWQRSLNTSRQLNSSALIVDYFQSDGGLKEAVVDPGLNQWKAGNVERDLDSEKTAILMMAPPPDKQEQLFNPSRKPVDLYSYGAGRFVAPGMESKDISQGWHGGILSNLEVLPSPERWLLDLHHASKIQSCKESQETCERARQCVIDVLPDIDDIEIKLTEKRPHSPQSVRVQFRAPEGWMLFEQLGLGYQSMAAWTIDLLRHLHTRFDHLEKPQTAPAIVLIDEFDLHLHPKWQLSLIDHLSQTFPNTQFVITAHSPLIVQAAPDANFVVLQRVEDDDGNQIIIADNDPVHVRGWRLDQLVTSGLFGLPSARPKEYSDLFDQRAKLVRKGSRSPEEDQQLQEITDKLEKEAPPSISPKGAELIAQLKAAQ